MMRTFTTAKKEAEAAKTNVIGTMLDPKLVRNTGKKTQSKTAAH